MKKIIALFFTCLLCFSLATGCSSSTTSYSKSGAYWLKNYQEHGVVDVTEKCEYKISVTDTKGCDVTTEITEGTYKTKLTTSTISVDGEEKACYKMETTMVLKGKYIYNSVEEEIDDSLTSVVYFSGYNDDLKPYRTEKHVVTTSPVNEGSKIVFKKISYDYTVDYGKKAVTSFTEIVAEGKDKVLPTPDKAEKSYNSSSFCENELLTFYPRMYVISNGFNISLSTFSVVQNEKVKLTVRGESCNKAMALTNDCWIDGINRKDTSINVDCLSFCQSGTYSGQKIYAYYMTHTKDEAKNVLVRFKSPVFSVGYFEYTLTNYTSNQV